MNKAQSFQEFLNEEKTEDPLNESFAVAAGLTILICLGIKGLRKLADNYVYDKEMPKDELIKFTKNIVNNVKEEGVDKTVNLSGWEAIIIKKINSDEIKTIRDVEKYIDSSRQIFQK